MNAGWPRSDPAGWAVRLRGTAPFRWRSAAECLSAGVWVVRAHIAIDLRCGYGGPRAGRRDRGVLMRSPQTRDKLRDRCAAVVVLAVAFSSLLAGPKTEATPALRAGGVYTNVDGFPFLAEGLGTGGAPQLWVVGHHGHPPLTAPKVYCLDIGSGRPCPDANGSKSWPMPLNTRALPLDTDVPGDIATTEIPQFVADPVHDAVYYPALSTVASPGYPHGSIGAGCIAPRRQFNCAYTPLAALTDLPGQSNVNGLAGFVRVGPDLYGTTTDGREVCMALANQAPCPHQPYATNTPPSDDRAGIGPVDFIGSEAAIDDRIYIASNGSSAATTTRPHLPTVSCFDPAIAAPCAGWRPLVPTTAADAYVATAVFPDYSPAGSIAGVCAIVTKRDARAPTLACDSVAGRSVRPPAGLASLLPSRATFTVVFPPLALRVGSGLRDYFPLFSSDGRYPGNTACYDWSAQAPCAGFPRLAGHRSVHGGDVRDYAYTATSMCIYGSGDRRYAFSMNPRNGTTGC